MPWCGRHRSKWREDPVPSSVHSRDEDVELRRLYAKLAFYDRPIDDFTNAVPNEPDDDDDLGNHGATLPARVRVLRAIRRTLARWLTAMANAKQRAMRGRAAPRQEAVFSQRDSSILWHDQASWRALHQRMEDNAAAHPRTRHVLDEGTKFRLGLSGLQVHDDLPHMEATAGLCHAGSPLAPRSSTRRIRTGRFHFKLKSTPRYHRHDDGCV